MPDYKEMYLTMVRETEKALGELQKVYSRLAEAQRRCEEMYISAPDEGQESEPQ